MKNALTHEEIRTRLTVYYRDLYDRWFLLMNEAKTAVDDGDDDAFKALSRRADKKSDFMDGIKAAAELLGIEPVEFMAAVNADRREPKPEILVVVTETGTDVFTGTKVQCDEYLDNALKNGSKPGFLRTITLEEWEAGAGNG